jgi:hypothetical protein
MSVEASNAIVQDGLVHFSFAFDVLVQVPHSITQAHRWVRHRASKLGDRVHVKVSSVHESRQIVELGIVVDLCMHKEGA